MKLRLLLSGFAVLAAIHFLPLPAQANCAWVLNNSCSDLGSGFAEKTGSETSFCDATQPVNGETKKCCCGPETAKGCCQKIQDGQTFADSTDMTIEKCRSITYATTTFFPGKIAQNNTCVDSSSTTLSSGPSKPIVPRLQVTIPGFGNFSEINCDDPNQSCAIPWLAEYIKALYNYSIIIIGVIAVIVMMVAGVMWLTAGGNSEQLSQAKQMIKGSLLGVLLAGCSYVILFLINPNLTILRPINLAYIEEFDLDDITVPIPPEEITNNPKVGEIQLDSNGWVDVPNDKSGAGIWTPKTERSSAQSVDALKKAADCFKKLDSSNSIRVSDASRTKAEQESLYRQNCSSGKCSPPTCNPFNGICPHTSGAAFDAWACKGSGCKGSKLQMELQQCMLNSGFCILSSECWHFEYPKVSGACGSTKHYNGKYCT